MPPKPLIDPERALWEEKIIADYGICGARHIALVNAVSGGDDN